MKCAECCYYWQDEDESRPRCHFEPRCSGDMAPCEYETMETADDPEDWFEDIGAEEEWGGPDMETGFDPYEGCYTWDC